MKCRNCKNLGKLKDEDGMPYDWCEKVCDNPDVDMERNCKHYETASNADRIRNMMDEELARYMVEVQLVGGCPGDVAMDCQTNCAICWLDWLKQEVDHADT